MPVLFLKPEIYRCAFRIGLEDGYMHVLIGLQEGAHPGQIFNENNSWLG